MQSKLSIREFSSIPDPQVTPQKGLSHFLILYYDSPCKKEATDVFDFDLTNFKFGVISAQN